MPHARSERAMGERPRCGRQFANQNQWHGCTTVTVANCLHGKSDRVVALYRAFEEVVHGCSPVRAHPTRACIGFIAWMTFSSTDDLPDAVSDALGSG